MNDSEIYPFLALYEKTYKRNKKTKFYLIPIGGKDKFIVFPNTVTTSLKSNQITIDLTKGISDSSSSLSCKNTSKIVCHEKNVI